MTKYDIRQDAAYAIDEWSGKEYSIPKWAVVDKNDSEWEAARHARDKALETPEPDDVISDAYIRANVLRLRAYELINSYPEGENIPDAEFLRIGYLQTDVDELKEFRSYWIDNSWFQQGKPPPKLGLNMTVLIRTD